MIRASVFFSIFLLVVSGCVSPYTRISKIKDNPQKYQDKQVSIEGKIVETLAIPFIQKGMFQVDDGSDRIWVMSQKRAPFRGDKVAVKGIVKTGFTISDRTFGTIIVE